MTNLKKVDDSQLKNELFQFKMPPEKVEGITTLKITFNFPDVKSINLSNLKDYFEYYKCDEIQIINLSSENILKLEGLELNNNIIPQPPYIIIPQMTYITIGKDLKEVFYF